MRELTVRSARLEGLYLISPFYTQDDRGYFLKSFEREFFRAKGIDMQIQESFESCSKKGVLRGMHFQSEAPQAKLVSCIEGRVFDVAVDLRQNSKTFGQWEGFYLDDEERHCLYIPGGFAHGFLAVSDTARVGYQCNGAYLPDKDTGIAWDDPDVNIEWPLHLVGDVQLSPRDRKLPGLQEHVLAQTLPKEGS